MSTTTLVEPPAQDRVPSPLLGLAGAAVPCTALLWVPSGDTVGVVLHVDGCGCASFGERPERGERLAAVAAALLLLAVLLVAAAARI